MVGADGVSVTKNKWVGKDKKTRDGRRAELADGPSVAISTLTQSCVFSTLEKTAHRF